MDDAPSFELPDGESEFYSAGVGEAPPPDWAAFQMPDEPHEPLQIPGEEFEDEGSADSEIGSTSQAIGYSGIGTCADVEVNIQNGFVRLNGNRSFIRVKYVYFWVEDEGWVKEDLSNKDIQYGFGHTWNNETLSEIFGRRIYNWAVYYRIRKPNGNLTSTVYEIVTPNKYGEHCDTDDWYSMTVDSSWTL
jgi:hypothetical protein